MQTLLIPREMLHRPSQIALDALCSMRFLFLYMFLV